MSALRITKSAKGVLTSLPAGKDAHEDQCQANLEDAVPAPQPTDPQQSAEETGKELLPKDDEGREEDFDEEERENPASSKEMLANLPTGESALVDQVQVHGGDKAQNHKPDAEEDEGDSEDEDELELAIAEPNFTDQDKSDLPVLEAKVNHHGQEQAIAIREIRQRKLWMLHRIEDGSRKYKTYDHYVQEVHGRSRQWASEQTQWLAIIEKLADLRIQGHEVPEMLTRNAVSGLCFLPECGNYQGDTEDEQEEAGLIAVMQEAIQDGVTLSHNNLRAICNRRYGFFRLNRWQPKPLASTYAEYKRDLALLEPLTNFDHSTNANRKVEEWAMDYPTDTLLQAVLAVYKQNLALPDNEFLLSAATGDELGNLVTDLVEIASTKEAEKAAKESREKARKARKSVGLPRSTKGVNPLKPYLGDTYKVELTGDFAKELSWSTKDQVSQEELLKLFQTLGNKFSPLTVSSRIEVVPITQQDEEDSDDDLEDYKPIEIENPHKPRLLDQSDPNTYFPED